MERRRTATDLKLRELRWNPLESTRAALGPRALRGLRLGLRILSSFAVLRRSVASRLPAAAALDDKSSRTFLHNL